MNAEPRESRESVVRLLWQATMPKAAWVGVVGGIFLVDGWWTWHNADHSLAAVVSAFQMPTLMLGYYLLVMPLNSEFYDRPKWLSRLMSRWSALSGLWPGEPTIVAPRTKAVGNAISTGPGASAVVQPVFTGMGAAFVGFGSGLMVIAAYVRPRSSEPLGWTIFWGAVMVLAIAQSIQRVTGVTRRLYAWSEEAAAAAATARTVADRARIASLQAQMNPHFLFNALNTVASLLGTDSGGARRTVQNLSSMLTRTLQRSAEPLATVEDEVQFARDYLDIERERFGSRLQVTYAIAPETAAMTVPTMSLQPLVENAIKHAIATRLEGGHIRISATKLVHSPSLRLSVEDDGPGFAPGSEDGTGLANLRARLRSLYGLPTLLTIETLPAGARVSITIPHYAHPDR